jgi:hypothetical protein
MNRIGFLLLAVGVILATLGVVYDEPRYTAIGLVPLWVLFVLAAAFTDLVDYTHSRHEEPMPAIMDFVWRGAAVIGGVLTVLALWHSTASGGTGIPLAVAAASLPASIFLYTVLNDRRVEEWRGRRAARRRASREESGT